MSQYTCLCTRENDGQIVTRLESRERPKPKSGEVLIKCEYSSLNYKDALAVTGRGRILKHSPLTPGIDVAGVVAEQSNTDFKIGQPVLVTGCGLGENVDGGLSEFAIVSAEHVIPLPFGLSTRESMIYGTAGFTAALCAHRMLTNGQVPEMGPILVTGASGGVGQFATRLLSKLGFEVWAVSEKRELHPRLKHIGAHKTLSIEELNLGTRPLEKSILGGAVDNVGGTALSKVMAHIGLWGNIACVGMAESAELKATVFPIILRGVSLLGISSNNTPRALREQIWSKLSGDWRIESLESFVHSTIGLTDVVETCQLFFNRKIHSRVLVKIDKN